MAKRKAAPAGVQPSASNPPDAEYVYALYTLKKAEGPELRLDALARKMRLLTEMQHELNIPEAYKAITKEVRTPFVRDTWHRTTAALNQKPFVVHIEPRDGRQDSERAANLGERWDTAVREALDKEIGEDTAIESSKALIRDGESVLKVVHRPDAWANFPKREGDDTESYSNKVERYKKGGAPIPIAWRVVDRLSMKFQDGEFGDEWAIEYGEYPRPYLGRRYGMIEDQDKLLTDPKYVLGGKPRPEGYLQTAMGRALKMEYWDAEWWHVVIDGRDAPGFPKPNPYAPRIPYFRAKGPDSESLLYSLLFLVPALDELLTMKLNWSYLGAYPNPIIRQLPNSIAALSPTGDAGETPSLSWRPGKALTLPPGWDMDFLSPPPIGKDLNDLVGILHQLIDIAGIPSVFRGMGGADQAGYAINQLMSAASLAFKVSGEALSRQFARAFEFMHWMVSYLIDQPVYVLAGANKDQSGRQWLALKPDGNVTSTEAPVDAIGPVEVEFKPTLPTDEQARAMIALQLTQAAKPLLSRKRALEKYLQEEDPEGVLDEIAVETALESPPLSNLVTEHALQDAGLAPRPTPQLLGPNGQPLAPSGAPGGPPASPPGVPGPAGAGLPAVPGVTMPLQPPVPQGPPVQASAPGRFPGQPGSPSSTMGGP